MIVIPAGHFLMGSSKAEAEQVLATLPHSDNLGILKYILHTPEGMAKKALVLEHPQHDVAIKASFALGVYPVTKGEYASFVQETGYLASGNCIHFLLHSYSRAGVTWQNPGFTQTDRDPVVCMSWQNAEAYVAWLNKKIQDTTTPGIAGPYRLPTEAEWEYAARGGTETARWWGDAIGVANANCGECGNAAWVEGHTTPIDYYHSNPFGLYDVLGNVFEYTEDCFHETYTGAPLDGRPGGDGHCSAIVVRGGAWSSDAWLLRSADRIGWEKSIKTNGNGFRVAKTLQ